MITLLNCIEQIPQVCENIVLNYENTFKRFNEYLRNKDINEIIFIGSGTSNTATITSAYYVEMVSGVRVNHYLPNEIINKTVLNQNALYVFVSQSGTSILTNKVLKKIKNNKLFAVGICADCNSEMVNDCDLFIDLYCLEEPYGMRTIGYVSTVITEIMLGLCIGVHNRNIDETKLKWYLDDLNKVKIGITEAIVKAQKWYAKNKLLLNDVDNIVIYGGKGLWGVSLEGSLKILEIARKVTSIGYEIDDGCHGPTMGYDNRYAVLILNLDDENSDTAQSLAKFAKGELKAGFIIGQNIIDDQDMEFNPSSNCFKAVEFAPFVQVLAYNLALHNKVDLKPTEISDPLPEKKYFSMHKN